MAERPTNEFNATALPSEELQRKLLYYAATGNEQVLTPFVAANGSGPKAEAERQRKDREFYDRMRLMLASPERIEQFTSKLNRLDQASAEALLEDEQKLRKTREELQRVRDRAYELTMPDGRTTKVYRDGNIVRDDSGAQLDPLLIKPEDIPDSMPTWQQRQDKEAAVRDAERQYRETVEYRERLERARKRLDGGAIPEDELDELERDVERMPAPVRQRYEHAAPPQDHALAPATVPQSQSPGTFASDSRPTEPFALAASGRIPAAPARGVDLDFSKVVPGVSTPAPG